MRLTKKDANIMHKVIREKYKFIKAFCDERGINYRSFRQYLYIRYVPDHFEPIVEELRREYEQRRK